LLKWFLSLYFRLENRPTSFVLGYEHAALNWHLAVFRSLTY